jgi:hypothetical protein
MHLILTCALLLASSHSAPKFLEPYDRYYGVYLNGSKVGWMHSTLTVQNNVARFDLELKAQVLGMGKSSALAMTENRSYDVKNKQLVKILFVQQATTGSVQVSGTRATDGLDLQIAAGGQTTKQHVRVRETLDDAIAMQKLAGEKKKGKLIKSRRFDPSLQKEENIEYRLLGSEKRILAGVPSDVAKIETNYVNMGIRETGYIDASGQLLESKMGGFFVARLEPQDVAKKLDYQQDVLVSAVVKSPKPIDAKRRTLQLTLSGLKSFPMPTSTRQRVQQRADNTVLTLTRDAQPKKVSLQAPVANMQEFLKPTAFIQSDAPELKQAARQAIGNAQDAFTASSRLVHYVFAHIEDEYVPAYSNALEAWKSGRGDCTEHSVLFVALARAAGIPARVAVGVGYWPPGNGFGWHAWSEVNMGGEWVSVDPTWDQVIADVTHIKLADGDPDAQARIVMLLGQLRVLDVKP